MAGSMAIPSSRSDEPADAGKLGEMVCVPRTPSLLIGSQNHLTSAHNDRADTFHSGHLGLAIQVEEPA
jgi:hypothetical protein